MKTYNATLFTNGQLGDVAISAQSLKDAKKKASYVRRRLGKGKVCNVFLVIP